MKKTLILPIPARRTLRKLGADINAARRRRRIPTAVMAERASMSPVTLNKIEKGDPGVSIGNVAKVLFVLGMTERLSDLADLRNDKIGLVLEHESLPKRIRAPKQPKQPKQPGPGGDK